MVDHDRLAERLSTLPPHLLGNVNALGARAALAAYRHGDEWLADLVYSSVPAALFGKRQVIEVGPMSGESNVVCWLEEHGVKPDPELVKSIFRRAKESSKVLDEVEIRAICEQHGFEVPVRSAS